MLTEGLLHEDRALLQAYRDGQTWAFEVLFRAYAEPVRRFLAGGFTFVSRGRTCRFRGQGSGIDTESIVQETFARAFAPSTRTNYDGERPFKNYLFSIAKNLVLREFQRRDRLIRLETTEETTDMLARKSSEQQFLPADRNPEHTFADGELHEVTKQFIATLDEEEKLFFLHRFAKGLTQEATAKEMGVTRARVKLLEKGMRKRFLDTLRGNGYFVGYTPKPRWTRGGEKSAEKSAEATAIGPMPKIRVVA
jgi:RNA polymerase sigma factor (sigma-70 family)